MLDTINKRAPKNIILKSGRAAKKPNNLMPSSVKYADRFRHLSNDLSPNEILFNNCILDEANDYNFSRMMPHFETVALAAGNRLYAAGEINNYVYFPETAVISHLCVTADGNSLEIAMVGSEGASGLCAVLGSQPTMHESIVTVEGQAWRIKTEILRQEFARAGKFQTLLIDYINAYLAEVSQRVVCESFHLVEKRLCRWLLMLHDRVRKNKLMLTHEQISQFLGVNRPTLTMAAKILRDQGLINYVRGQFYILDRQKLEASACECYSAVHATF